VGGDRGTCEVRAGVAGAIVLAATLLVASVAGAQAELRGIWSHATAMDTPGKATALADSLANARLNAIYPLFFYWGGTAYWDSRVAPRADVVQQGFDPLASFISLAHARGIEVHPRFVVGNYGTSELGRLFPEHPAWRLANDRGETGDWYDLANPEVRDFMLRLVEEVATKYPVDGIHLDFIRYPGLEWGYTAAAKAGFARECGYSLDAIHSDGFPIIATVTGNVISGPTTARVLAAFGDGRPAVSVNDYGRGQCLTVSWQAFRSRTPAGDEMLRRALRQFGAQKDLLRYVLPPPTRETYGTRYADSMQAWLRENLGLAATAVDPANLEALDPHSVLVLPGCYLFDAASANGLALFVGAGGRAIFVDAPIRAMDSEHIRNVSGLSKADGSLNAYTAIVAVAEHPFLPIVPGSLTAGEAVRVAEAWVRFREDQVTSLVRLMREKLRSVRPDCLLTASVFRSVESSKARLQDWPLWLREGLVDYVMPMAYTSDIESLRANVDEWQSLDPQWTRIIPGLAIYNVGNDSGPLPTPDAILAQYSLCRQRGARGVCFFSANQLTPELQAALRERAFTAPCPAYRPPASRAAQSTSAGNREAAASSR